MNDESVKTKRRSTKKAARAQAAPAPKAVQREEFIIGNIRCFADEQRVPIRPVTLLVGENSTGKTTFLGMYRVLSEILSSTKKSPGDFYSTAFNTPPFPMGRHPDIVRSESNEFCLGWSGMWPSEFAVSAISDIKFFFGGEEKLPFLSRVFITFQSGDELEIRRLADSGVAIIVGPDFSWDTGMSMDQMHFEIPDIFTHIMLQSLAQRLFVQSGDMEFQIDFLNQEQDFKKMGDFMQNNLGLKFVSPDKSDTPIGVDNTSRKESGTLQSKSPAPFAPMRSKPKRTYGILDDDPEHEGGDIPTLLFRMASRKPKELEVLRNRIKNFGETTEMFSDLQVVEHGPHSSDDFHLEVDVRGTQSNIMDVGYGVSQVYPMLAHFARAAQRGVQKIFLLQQPEVHLHPRAQAELGSFFVNSVIEDGHTFLVETHSDFIVDRVRICVADGLIDPEDVSLLYFEPKKSDGNVKIHRIKLNSKGEPVDVPAGYRKFFLRETERVLGFRG